MVELHGWATLRENYAADDEESHIEQIVASLNQKIDEMDIDRTSLQINYSNGEALVTAAKFTNHFSEDIKDIVDFFRQIALLTPGSYGLLYLHDDEDRDGFDNAFQVFVLAKGNFALREDPFLSPYFPTVEEISEGG